MIPGNAEMQAKARGAFRILRVCVNFINDAYNTSEFHITHYSLLDNAVYKEWQSIGVLWGGVVVVLWKLFKIGIYINFVAYIY